MKTQNLSLSLLFLIGCISVFSTTCLAKDNLYAVGPFNGWDARNPVPFEKEGDVFSITLDFSNDNAFKMSTVSGASSEGNGWTEFDSGALKPVEEPTLGKWVGLKSDYRGDIYAPGFFQMVVEVNLVKNEMRFTKAAAPTYSGTLPVIFINTENCEPINSKETYISATYWLDPCGNEDVEAIGTSETQLPLQIRGRGNWTWTGFDKKPYRIKLGEKAPLAGLTKSKHFVLLAHADDNIGFMRNTLGFAASSMFGLTWTPAQRPVEVVLNGEYIGLYFLTENIRIDKNRVNVTEQEDYASTDVDGGWLVEIDNYDSDPHVTVYEGSYPIWFTYKSPELLSNEQSDFLKNEMQSIQDAIVKKNFDSFSSLVDVDMLARYYIVQEVMNDYESFHGSCYIWRQRGEGEKWNFGPVWDFGSALFNDDNNFIYNSVYHQVWIGEIVKNFPEFNEVVKSIWFELLEDNVQNRLVEYGKSFAEKISKAAASNYLRWPQYGNQYEGTSAEIAFRRLNSKMDWLRTKWGEPSGVEEVIAYPSKGMYSQSEGVQTKAKRIFSQNGALHIYSPVEIVVTIVTPSGIARKVTLHSGENFLPNFPSGLYLLLP